MMWESTRRFGEFHEKMYVAWLDETIKALFAAMPSGLNPEAADGMDAVVQFHLTGSETMDGKASYHKSAPRLDYSMAVA